MKHTLILTAGYGEGHNTAARNIAAAVRHLGGEADVLDPFAEAYPQTNDFLRRGYLTAINKSPRLWQTVYFLLDRTDVVPRAAFWMRRAAEVIRERVTDTRPAAVCSTYPAYNLLINRLRARARLPEFLQATCVTDSISVNSLWHKAGCDLYLVPNEETAGVMEQAGVHRGQMRVTGFPVQLDFALPERRLPPPACDGSRCRILYMVNSGRARVPGTLDRLMSDPRVDLTVSIGREESLRPLVESRAARWNRRVDIITWTDRMPQLLMTHHLLVTKAGGATVQEALAAGTPLLINQIVPGQEQGNYDLVGHIGAGALAVTPDEVARAVDRALADGARRLNEWRANIHRASRPAAALDIARILMAGTSGPR